MSPYINFKLSHFKFSLPKELIAEKPSDYRDECRMMVLDRKKRTIEHYKFKDLINFLGKGDLVMANDTKVFPARIYGEKEKTGAQITVFLIRELNEEMRLWDVIVDPARKIRIGNKLFFGNNESLVAEVIDNTTSRGRTIRFLYDGTHDEFIAHIKSLGHTPIPDEILKMRDLKNYDNERYQTIFAANEGAVVAPIAGLHISREFLLNLKINKVDFKTITLHLGLPVPIEVEDLSKHRINSEEMYLNDEVAQAINETKKRGNKVCSIGLSTMRAIETAAIRPGEVFPFSGWTNKFIFPRYDFSIADMLVTNFHHSLSPSYIMAAAFADPFFLADAYQVAIKEKYRFSTYGDCMLII